LEHHLAADGEADPADPPVADVRLLLQPRDGGVDVLRVVPAEQVRVALTAVVATRVEQEHSVAVAGEHPRLRQLALTRRV
jgi:hypothetical protein